MLSLPCMFVVEGLLFLHISIWRLELLWAWNIFFDKNTFVLSSTSFGHKTSLFQFYVVCAHGRDMHLYIISKVVFSAKIIDEKLCCHYIFTYINGMSDNNYTKWMLLLLQYPVIRISPPTLLSSDATMLKIQMLKLSND